MTQRRSKYSKDRPAADSGKLGRELVGLFSIFCGLLLMLSLATFDSRDPWLNHVVSGVTKVHNKAGLFGSYIAGILYDVMGIAAWIFPGMFCLAGARRILGKPGWPWWRWTGLLLLAFSLCLAGASRDLSAVDVLARGVLPPGSGNVSSHGGGLIGHALYTGLVGWLSSFGTFVVWIGTFMVAIQMLTGVSWITLTAAGIALLYQGAQTVRKKALAAYEKRKNTLVEIETQARQLENFSVGKNGKTEHILTPDEIFYDDSSDSLFSSLESGALPPERAEFTQQQSNGAHDDAPSISSEHFFPTSIHRFYGETSLLALPATPSLHLSAVPVEESAPQHNPLDDVTPHYVFTDEEDEEVPPWVLDFESDRVGTQHVPGQDDHYSESEGVTRISHASTLTTDDLPEKDTIPQAPQTDTGVSWSLANAQREKIEGIAPLVENTQHLSQQSTHPAQNLAAHLPAEEQQIPQTIVSQPSEQSFVSATPLNEAAPVTTVHDSQLGGSVPTSAQQTHTMPHSVEEYPTASAHVHIPVEALQQATHSAQETPQVVVTQQPLYFADKPSTHQISEQDATRYETAVAEPRMEAVVVAPETAQTPHTLPASQVHEGRSSVAPEPVVSQAPEVLAQPAANQQPQAVYTPAQTMSQPEGTQQSHQPEEISPAPEQIPASAAYTGEIRIFQAPAVEVSHQQNSYNETLPRKKVLAALPALDLLEAAPASGAGTPHSVLEEKGRSLMTCLSDFGIQGELVGITPGPVVTMFEVRPAPGVRVSRIANLSDDLALALKAVAVRIQAPVPGTDTVGIEIPNAVRETVCLKELLSSTLFQQAPSLLTLALGKDIAGLPAVADLATMPHMLVAGATGAGKSVGINSIILSLLYKARPEEVKLLLIDPKRVEMAIYADLPHLVHPVVTEMQLAKNALEWAVSEMENRYTCIARASVRNIADYNAKVTAWGNTPPEGLEDLEHLPYLVIIIDELADLMLVAAKEVETSIVRLAQLARAAGIHLILATQRPSVDVVTGLIKANFPCRISFQVTSKHDSRTILDTVGAEHLLGKGDMLFKPAGGKFQRMHGAFVSDHNVIAVVDYWRSRQKPNYKLDFADWAPDMGAPSGGNGGSDTASDPMYNEAVEFVRQQGKASISLIQRKFRIGFNKAARFVEQMEQDGIIGPADGSKPRTVNR